MKYDEAREKFITSWGTLGTNWGINRTMAQIHALLLIETEALSTEDVMEELVISRGNAHMNLQALIEWGLIEKTTIKGERKTLYVADKDVWQIAKKVAKERKKRELESIIEVFRELQDVDGSHHKSIEFKKVTTDLSDFACKADSFISKFIVAKSNWFLKLLKSLAG